MNSPTIPSVDDDATNRGLQAIGKAFDRVVASPFIDAVVLAPVSIGTTDTRVCHGLGRPLRGYFLVKSPSDVRVFDGAVAESAEPKNFATLRLSTAAKVTLVVF